MVFVVALLLGCSHPGGWTRYARYGRPPLFLSAHLGQGGFGVHVALLSADNIGSELKSFEFGWVKRLVDLWVLLIYCSPSN